MNNVLERAQPMMMNSLPNTLTMLEIYQFIDLNSRVLAHRPRNRAMYCLRAHTQLRVRDIASLTVNDVLTSDMTLKTEFVSDNDGRAYPLDEHTRDELTLYLCAKYQIELLEQLPITRYFDVMFETSKTNMFSISTLCQHFCLQDKAIRDFAAQLQALANAQNRSFQRLFLKNNSGLIDDHKKRSKSVFNT